MKATTTYKCDYCDFTCDKAAEMIEHEKNCLHNPEKKINAALEESFNNCLPVLREAVKFRGINYVGNLFNKKIREVFQEENSPAFTREYSRTADFLDEMLDFLRS